VENFWIAIGLAPFPGLGKFIEGTVAEFVRSRPQLLTTGAQGAFTPVNPTRHQGKA
jgi:hypothetical protein